MGEFYTVLIGLAGGIVGYGVVAALVAANALVKHKDEEFKKRYQEHLERQRRVEARLKSARESLTERHQ